MEYYELVRNWAFTGIIGFWTYWVPLVLCAIGYSVKTFKQIQALKNYDHKTSSRYVEDLTISTIIWRVVLTVTPIVNVLSLSFSLASDMVKQVFDWIEKVLSVKLVKKST